MSGFVNLPLDAEPTLSVVIHTEEQFDWSKAFSRNETRVDHIQQLDLVQSIFDNRGVTPLYVVDYPVANDRQASDKLKSYYTEGRIDIGTHLQPWVSPPYDEDINNYNSFPCNLPRNLEYEKISRLTAIIEQNLRMRPTCYLAGRYGFGHNTAEILRAQDYSVDLSASPAFDYSADGGPDYSNTSNHMRWLDEEKSLLSIPGTGAYIGLLHSIGPLLHNWSNGKLMSQLKLAGAMSRIGLMSRVRLSPEGYTLEEQIVLTEHLYKAGLRHFIFSFHSPSVLPGLTSYVTTTNEQIKFLNNVNEYLEYFSSELNGVFKTPTELRTSVLTHHDR